MLNQHEIDQLMFHIGNGLFSAVTFVVKNYQNGTILYDRRENDLESGQISDHKWPYGLLRNKIVI